MPQVVVEARQLTRRFAAVAALTGVDIELRTGDALALLGPNGAGKSTLLKLLATLLRPTAGTLRLFGADAQRAAHDVRRGIGMLSHHTFLYPDLSPLQNLDFFARLYGLPDRHRIVADWIERTGLSGWANRPVRTLSRGLEQRCALARALLHQPRLLLLDEPFTGLDRAAAALLSGLIDEFRRAGGTVVMTTHDVEAARAMATRLCILRGGRIYWLGGNRPEDRPAFEHACRVVLDGGAE